MYRRERILRVAEMMSYVLVVFGVLFDQVSTRLALQLPGTYEIRGSVVLYTYIYETNSTVAWLMQRGLWLPADIILVVVLILIPYYLIRKLKIPGPIIAHVCTFGLIRLGAGILNMRWLV